MDGQTSKEENQISSLSQGTQAINAVEFGSKYQQKREVSSVMGAF